MLITKMPRPKKHRKIKCTPTAYYFKPRAISLNNLEEVILEQDELESLRLADMLAYSHEQSAEQMKISRATFGRILEKARFKLIDAIMNGKAIRINEELPIKLKGKIKVCGECKSRIRENKNQNTCTNCKKIKE